jgi:hypothetical protein
MLKPNSKRKRTKAELEEVKEEEKFLKENRQQFLKAVKQLRVANQSVEEEKFIIMKENELLSGIINNAGFGPTTS